MGRFKRGVKVSRDCGVTNKRDTPMKTAVSRRYKCRRLLPNKHYGAVPEEPEVEEMNVLTVKPSNPVVTGIQPVHRKSSLSLSSPAFTDNPRGKAASPAAPANERSGHRVSPAGHPTIQMTPHAEAFKGGEMQVKEEGEQNVGVTPESITSSSMESETTFNSDDDDDEEDCYSSASPASSSLPSPEIFRKRDYVETSTLPIKEELSGLHSHIKNSTLLDWSCAESIHMHQPPDLSTIIDASAIPAVNSCEINQHKGPEAQTKIHADSLKSDKAFKGETPSKIRKSPGLPLHVSKRKPILCRKKVCFKSPIIPERFEAKHIPATKLTTHKASEPVNTSSPAPDADTSRAGEIKSEEEASRLTVRLRRPIKRSQEKAKFFDFVDDSDRDAFFQRMRERWVKLTSAPPFPLTAATHIGSSVLGQLKPKY